ncbi:LuxR C-terminal-related transcriptional regulator [Stieleria sp. JC731]|uniref:LuxR C-terminal-related transcriptional regulator n=1 Tax=Pirellulaceae TaxID=2691357 RepID=UPI001E4949A7|nr:LuxR C-terminal-related transcriptional regulator [Stieleria sp. JC731]MCC9600036.1 LuxR C-terminal-related transcriptional regulator [Stieleria sp. JC731]
MSYLSATLDLPRIADFVAPFMFMSQDKSGVITTVSDSASDILGYDPSELSGKPLSLLLAPNSHLNETLTFLGNNDTSHVLLCVRCANQESRILSQQRQRVVVDGEVRFHSVVVDVTDEVRQYQTMVARLEILESINRSLSEQEHQVAERIVAGMLNRQIADELKVSERTVDRRRASLMDHYGVDSAAELVSQLAEHSLLRSLLQSIGQSNWRRAVNANKVNPNLLSRSA